MLRTAVVDLAELTSLALFMGSIAVLAQVIGAA